MSRRTLIRLAIAACLAALGVIFVPHSAFAATTYYMSPSGSDTNAGTMASPWKAFAATCTTSSPTGTCGPYHDPNVFTSTNGNDLVVQNDFQSISQTLTATDSTQWSVTANTTGLSDQTSVKSYPATQVTYTTTSDKPEPSGDFGSTLTSGFTNTIPSGSGQDYEYAFDDWLGNPNQQSWTGPDTEVMIWTYVNGQVPFGNDTGKVYTDAAGTQWELWTGGGASSVSPHSTLSLVRKTNATSGSIDRIGFYTWLQGQGELSSTFGIDQLNYGLEICSTGGAAKTYGVSGYSIVPNGSGAGGAQAPAVTTSAASGVGQAGATLNGSVNPEGQSASYQFDYGTSASYGSSVPVPAGSAGSGSSSVPESAAVTGLSASTTYHYRIEATNATGTTFGADQQFTTSSAGGGSVGVGDFRGSKAANTRTLTWSIGVGTASDRAILAEATVGDTNDVGCGQTVTDNGVAMNRLAVIHTNGQTAGYMDIWGDTNPAPGNHVFTLTVTGCQGGTPKELTGGSIEFAGVSQGSPFSVVTSATGSGSTPSVTAGSAAGDLMAGFVANGSAINSASSPSTSRFIENQDALTGAGNSAGATSPATGSPVTMSWNAVSDWWGAGVTEVQHA